MTRIASVDVFVCGFTIPNGLDSASKLNSGNGEFIAHEYNIFVNSYRGAVRCCEAVKADRGRLRSRGVFRVREHDARAAGFASVFGPGCAPFGAARPCRRSRSTCGFDGLAMGGIRFAQRTQARLPCKA